LGRSTDVLTFQDWQISAKDDMRIPLTRHNGCIGTVLAPMLVAAGHDLAVVADGS